MWIAFSWLCLNRYLLLIIELHRFLLHFWYVFIFNGHIVLQTSIWCHWMLPRDWKNKSSCGTKPIPIISQDRSRINNASNNILCENWVEFLITEYAFLRNRRRKQFITIWVNIQSQKYPHLYFVPIFFSTVKLETAYKEISWVYK